MTRLFRSHSRALMTATVVTTLVCAAANSAAAETCDPGTTRPTVVVQEIPAHGFDAGTASLLTADFIAQMRQRVPEARWTHTTDLQRMAGYAVLQQMLGNSTDFAQIIVEALGSEFAMFVEFLQTGTGGAPVVSVTATIYAGSSGQIIARVGPVRLPTEPDEAIFATLDQIASELSVDLFCRLVGARVRPVAPSLSVPALTDTDVSPGGSVGASVTLTDADTRTGQSGYDITFALMTTARDTLTTVGAITTIDGQAIQTITAPNAPGTYLVEARFVRNDDRKYTSAAATLHVTGASGGLTLSAAEVGLHVGDGETVTAQRTSATGQPVEGATVQFSANGGSVSAAAATTDTAGQATITYQAPATNAVVDVTATAPAGSGSQPLRAFQTAAALDGPPPPEEPPLTATLTFVVDGQVTISASAPDTIEGGTTTLTVDIAIGGTPAASIPVTFTLNGPGQLSETSADTDAAGRAEIVYFAPTASASITVTVSAIVDGQTYTRDVTFAVGSVSPSVFALQYIGATNCTDGTGLVELRFTPYPGGTSPPPSLPYTLSQSACGGHVDLTVQLASDNGVELAADLDEAANQYASGSAVVAATLTRDGVLEIDLNPAWATSTPDPFPGQYGLYGDVVIQDSSFKILGRFTYDFTNQRVVRSDAPAILAAGSYYFVMQYGGSNNAANVGRGRLVTVRIR